MINEMAWVCNYSNNFVQQRDSSGAMVDAVVGAMVDAVVGAMVDAMVEQWLMRWLVQWLME